MFDDLAKANTPEARTEQPWVVAMAHRPMYCSDSDGDDCTERDNVMRTGYKHEVYKLEDLFFNNSVDLQVYGHEHNYKKSFPIYDYILELPEDLSYYKDPKFPVHIISGAGGVVKTTTLLETNLGGLFSENLCTASFIVEPIDRLTLNMKMYSVDDGGILNELTIAKSSEMPRFNLDLVKKKKV